MNNELLQFIDQQIFDLMQKKQEIMFKMVNPRNNQYNNQLNLNNYGQYQAGGQPIETGSEKRGFGNESRNESINGTEGINSIKEGTKKTEHGSETTTFIRRKGKPSE